MASNPVGKMYVELDLDATKYTRAQKDILAGAEKNSADINKVFKTVGTQSDEMYNAMRKNIENALNAIKTSHLSTYSEIERAKRTAADKIKKIDDEQFGKTDALLASIKNNWMGAVAAIYATRLAVDFVSAPFEKGFKAVEEYSTSVASLAAMVVTFSERQAGQTLEGQWQGALNYSTAMVPVLENIAAKTLLSGQETTALANAFARSGVFLDANNAKQVESFTRVSNALPLMTQGQEIMRQINTEIRSLMNGTNESSSMMLTTLKAIDPAIESNLKTWREEGTVLEHIGDLLAGFGPATAILENQWQAVKSTLDTTATQILRGLMQPAYESIIESGKDLNEWMVKNKDTIIEWGTVFRVNLISVQAEVMRLAMLLDKAGGTMTSAKMLLYGPGAALGVESSTKRFEAAAAANMEYEARYLATDKALENLAKKQIDLEGSLQAAKKKTNEIPPPPKGTGGVEVKEQIDAYKKAWSAGAYTEEAYNVMAKQYEKDRDGFIAAGADKVTAQRAFDEQMGKLWDTYTGTSQKKQDAAANKAQAEAERLAKAQEAAAESYRKIMAGEYDFAATENERAINKIIKDADEKARKLQTLADTSKISESQLAADIVQINANKNAAILAKETETAHKISKLNYDLISGVRGWEAHAYAARLQEIEAKAKKDEREGASAVNVAAWKRDETEKAYIQMAKSGDDFFAGASAGWLDLERTMESRGRHAADLVVKAFNGMADALTDFVTTGKLDFKSLADSIVRDLIRMAVQESMVKSLGSIGGGLFGAIGGLLGGKAVATGAGINSAGFADAAGGFAAFKLHQGGIVGGGGGLMSSVSPSIFHKAPRLHSGLSWDEFPAILQKGEEVTPKDKVGRKQGASREQQPAATTNNYFIQAVDAKSFADLCRTNPAAITGPMMAAMRDNKIRSEMKSLVR